MLQFAFKRLQHTLILLFIISVFVFFIMTVAAAESAIGLAILVVLFRERKSINVEQLDTMKG